MSQVLGPLCSAISSIACFLAAFILLTFKRKSKVLFRLEIGLCFALGAAHFANFFMAIPQLLHPHDLSYYIFLGIRVVMLGATIHYLVVIFLTFLLNTLRWTQEKMAKNEKWLHIMTWLMCVLNLTIYTDAVTGNRISGKKELAISLSFLGTEGTFIIICCIFVHIKQRRMFQKNSEILSPLVTTRSKKSLESFLRRLSILTIVSCLIFLQVFLFVPEIRDTVNQALRTDYISDLFLLDGFLVSLILTTTPSLITQYRKAYIQWTSSYTPIPVSPLFNLESSPPLSPKPKIDFLALSNKQLGMTAQRVQ
eukprot:Phypoly_transcript_12395.p1 GENE.Phypoly_transcript_12395~~Phypoly_transcript_12395.p1  ORF type:complete len:309 (+),score=25.44 Phypoly_transcript_12395:153-1079(+)